VGKEVVKLSRDANDLHQGAGENDALKANGFFEQSPHLIAATPSRIASLHAAEIGTSGIGGDRYLVAGRFILDAVVGQWRDIPSEDRGHTIRSLIAAFEDAELGMRQAAPAG